MIWKPEPRLREDLDAAVPGILVSQKPNGQFGTEPWISTDQNVLLPLAAAWHLSGSAHYHSDVVLDAIVRGGYALIDAMDAQGMWTFRKKDRSTWGQIYMPWAYSRWIRAYALVREAMGTSARARWDEGLLKGYSGISATCLERVHNIPAHHAMGLYFAGVLFGRTDWREQAAKFMERVAGAQSEHGWWPEHDGPVVLYNFVYSDSLGVYYSMSGDGRVLEALGRAAHFHAAFTYPDGSAVETVDGRNPYHKGVRLGNPGFSHTPAGRGFLAQQHRLHAQTGGTFDADYAASMLLYAGEGEAEEAAGSRDVHGYTMGVASRQALAKVDRRKPWFVCRNAFRRDPHNNRWGQDWQNFVSVYHDRAGLILGGGNTKLQPLWSSFTVGDTELLKHSLGDTDPAFLVRRGLQHVPDAAALHEDEGRLSVTLVYGAERGTVTIVPRGDGELGVVFEATAAGEAPMEGHLTLIPSLGMPLRLSTGDVIALGPQPFSWTVPGKAGAVEHNGWRLLLPGGLRVTWPALPHNPYRKGGEAEAEEGRIVVLMPFMGGAKRHEMVVQVG